MLQMQSSSSFCRKYYYPLQQQTGCVKTLQLPLTKVHSSLNRSERKNYPIECTQSDSFYSTNKIRNTENASSRNCKPFNKYRLAVPLQQQSSASNYEHDVNSTSFRDVLLKKLNALYLFTRPFAMLGTIVGITSISILPLQSFADLTPKYFMEFLKALFSAVLMNTYVGAVNQLADVEIDKVNKPELPLASGDLSMGTGLAITLITSLTSLAIALSIQSPPLVFGLIVWFLLGTAYSVDVPFLRWKSNPFLAGMCMVIVFGLVYQFSFFIHLQKYVLGRPVVITRPLIFAAAIICTFSAALSLLKDIPDEDGDKKFGIHSISSKLGKEKVHWLCVYTLSFAYGVAVIIGASSSSQLGKLVSIIGHSTLAFLLWFRAQTVDLSNNASTFSFYLFIWKKYVLGRPVVITRPLIFAAAIVCTISAVMSLLKVLRLCVYTLSFAYVVAVIVGASSSFQLGKLVSKIGHTTLAFLLWLRAQTVDLSNNASTFSFYLFIWKASVIGSI